MAEPPASSSQPRIQPSSSTAPPDAGAKPKSAKELKKEKRAAAVAARGPGEGSGSTSQAPAPAANGSHRPGSSKGPPASASAQQTPASPSNPHADVLSTILMPASSPAKSSSHTTSKAPKGSENLFYSHLPRHFPPDTTAAYTSSKIHPAVVECGTMMSSGELRGANARTMAMMLAFRQVIEDYQCPEQTVLWKDLPNHLSPMIAWLEDCRPKGVGGGNGIRWLKAEINVLGETDLGSDAEQKGHLIREIDVYLRNRIEYADQIIVEHAQEKIIPGSTIVTYARSSIVEKVLLEAWRSMRETEPNASFRVVVVDSRPLNEGRSTMLTLSRAGIPTTYTLLPLASSVLPSANLVLVGASALHSDGSLYSRAGTAVISMLAKEYRVPVVACVETYKFGERVVLDSVASNEIGDPSEVLKIPGRTPKSLSGKDELPAGLTPLSLMYDLTPPEFITTLCTELGFIPPSSVPTVLGKNTAGS